MRTPISPTYQAARDKINAASQQFSLLTQAYRAGTISDAEFLSARAAYDADSREFDAAYDAEYIRQTP